ncbi:YtxH domain-containing protein [Ferrimonas senticii]|uniref:YtxH domain-containing protein n=1 Tax=Ferrimonas senticii TaxID=394566 RepID=UPI000421A6C0|nr:YtxH domain-containing protein [Ferrimonas senticii]
MSHNNDPFGYYGAMPPSNQPQQPYGNGYPNPYQSGYPQPYAQQNGRTHFISGLIAGAAVAYLLSNKKVQQSVSNVGTKAWSTVRGEVEELKERLEDTQAELEYYRNLHKEQQ